MNNGKYILDDAGNPVEEVDLLTWAKWFENNTEKRRVGFDILEVKDIETGEPRIIKVSTVFLGLDHSFSGDKPILWESMSFGNGTDDEMQERYYTKEEAIAGHNAMVSELKQKYGLATPIETQPETGSVGTG